MQTRGAIVLEPHRPWEIVDLEVLPPEAGEVLVRWDYAGLCNSDEHGRNGAYPIPYPMVGGHEGAGVVVEVGAGVTTLAVGDHVAATTVEMCGHCRWCVTGHSVMCNGQPVREGGPDVWWRFRGPGGLAWNFGGVATFSGLAVVPTGFLVKIPRDVPLQYGVLASCGLMTGWGAVNRAGELRPGETVAVFGAGGIGINSVLGASRGGATNVIVVDPLASKRAFALEMGATHAFASASEAQQAAADLNPTAGGADLVVVAAGTLNAEIVRAAFDVAGTRGRIVVVAMTEGNDELRVPGMPMIGREKRLIGSQYGSCNPASDIPMLLDMAMRGILPLERLISATYPLSQIERGYQDLAAGRNIRGVIDHSIES